MLVRSSPKNSFASEILGQDPLSLGTCGYLSARAKNAFYDFVITKFLEAERAGLTKAQLARRINKSPEQVSRWLGAAGNWTIETAALLLAGIAREELLPYSVSFANRSVSNRRTEDMLDEIDWDHQSMKSGSQPLLVKPVWNFSV